MNNSNINQPETYNLVLVEDDTDLANLISDYLQQNGFNVSIISDGIKASESIPEQQPDLVLLDIMLPGMSGMDVCKAVRLHYQGPIIMLTALDDDMDQMIGLELGADDYIIKPVHPRLLLTRIRVLLRRILLLSKASSDTTLDNQRTIASRSTIQVGRLNISLERRSVSLGEKNIQVTTAEFELLVMLAQDAGNIVPRETIIQELRGLDYDGLDRSIDRRVSRLRKKLQCGTTQEDLIKTIRGKGYQLCIL